MQDLVPLLVQENYVNHRPRIANNEQQRMSILAKAANDFSAGDLVSRVVRQNQVWSLMPFACALGTVNPASYARGGREVFGLYPTEQNFPRFSAWLGQNSSHRKQKRLLGEIHTDMHSSGNFIDDTDSLRLSYLPALRKCLTAPLEKKGKDGIEDVIKLMNEYALRREDFDAILDMTTFKTKHAWGADVYKKLEASVKSAFTRSFNKQKTRAKSGLSVGDPRGKRSKQAKVQDDEDDIMASLEGEVKVEDSDEDEKDLDITAVKRKFADIQGNASVKVDFSEKSKPSKASRGKKSKVAKS